MSHSEPAFPPPRSHGSPLSLDFRSWDNGPLTYSSPPRYFTFTRKASLILCWQRRVAQRLQTKGCHLLHIGHSGLSVALTTGCRDPGPECHFYTSLIHPPLPPQPPSLPLLSPRSPARFARRSGDECVHRWRSHGVWLRGTDGISEKGAGRCLRAVFAARPEGQRAFLSLVRVRNKGLFHFRR